MGNNYDVLHLFSAGLDSLIAAKMLQEQGLKVKCLHFHSPFYGKPWRVPHWREEYGLDIDPVDNSAEFVEMVVNGPDNGFGKHLNPCVDCKILMLRRAKELLPHYGATFISTGEVLGQRPMSQRRDTMNIIRRDAEVKDLLLRPLCAKTLDPTPMEQSGLVDRAALPTITGRGRTRQLELARHFGIKEIPTPGGGCRLAEAESAKRYLLVLEHAPRPGVSDFHLSNVGRQYWSGAHWLAIGRNQADNEALEQLTETRDLIFDLQDFPGPSALGRQFEGAPWSAETTRDAASLVASFCPKAVRSGGEVAVLVREKGETKTLHVTPSRNTPLDWREPVWERKHAQQPV
jgi:tRNA-specific 2-thiouridylase